MKNFQELLVELNKFEKDNVKRSRAHMIKQMGHGEYKRMGLTKDDPLKAFDKVNAKLRSNPNNPNLSPRREAENVIKKFQDVEPGQKGAGNRVDPRTGKVSQYDVTKVRHDELRGVSKKKTAEIQKLYKGMGDKMKSDLYKNIGGSQNRRLYQPPFSGTELERAARDLDMFPKTKLGSPTTANIPKGKIPEPPKLKPPTTFKPPKGSVGAMRNVYKAKPLYKKVLTKIKNPKLALGAAALTAGIAGVQALRKRAMKEDMSKLPGLGGGGGGTDSITDKSPAKSFKKRVKDVGKILTFPLHKRRKDPTEKFATEGVAALAVKGGSKLIPALMTGIGAAGTIMQAKKKSKGDEKLREIARQQGLDLTDPRQRMKAMSRSRTKSMKGKVNNPEGPVYKKKDNIQDEFSAPTNSVGGGQIAGTVEAGDNPPVKKKKRAPIMARGKLPGARTRFKNGADFIRQLRIQSVKM